MTDNTWEVGKLGDHIFYELSAGHGLLGEGTWRVQVRHRDGTHTRDPDSRDLLSTFVISEEAADEYIDLCAEILGVERKRA